MTGTSLSPYVLFHCSSSDGLAGAGERQFGDRGFESHGLAQLKVGDNDLEYCFKYREGESAL